MLKKAFAILSLSVVALLAVQPASATAAGPLPAVGSAPAANRQRDDDQGQGDQGQGDQGQGDQGQNEDHGHGGGYVPSGSITITGLPVPGGTITIIFAPGSFRPGEHVTIILGGRNGQRITLGAVGAEAAALGKEASADGSLNVTMALPQDATGTQTVTATGATSGNVGTAATTVVPQDVAPNPARVSLAATETTLPVPLIWAGAGALLLGIGAVAMRALVRRQRPPA